MEIITKPNNKKKQTLIVKTDKQIIHVRIIHDNKTNSTQLYLKNSNSIITIEHAAKIKPARRDRSEVASTDNAILSPLSGSIVNIHVKVGDLITPGQAVVTIESMKMENEIRASCTALVKTIPIALGFVVEQTQVLVTLEPVASLPKQNSEIGETDDGKTNSKNIEAQI